MFVEILLFGYILNEGVRTKFYLLSCSILLFVYALRAQPLGGIGLSVIPG